MTDNLLDALAKPPPPPSELDELMSRDPLELTKENVDSIIAYQRQARARRESGGKVKREKGTPQVESGIDLLALVTRKPTIVPSAPKPSGGGFRRF